MSSVHAILLGDSIFDNAAYVSGGVDVTRHLQERLGARGRASLLAVDGSVTTGVATQLQRLPGDATHLFVSTGGNDALDHLDFLDKSARSVADVLTELSERAEAFENRYHTMLASVLQKKLPTTICTIYYPRFPDPHLQRISVTALNAFNDVIMRAAFARGLDLLDLRLICDEDGDYANPIEPSVQGGAKIVNAIAAVLAGLPQAVTRVVASGKLRG